MTRFLPYFVVRHAAADLDRRGIPPGPVVTLLAGIASLATLGLAGVALFGVSLGVLGAFGFIH